MYFWLLLQIYPSDLKTDLWSRVTNYIFLAVQKQHSQRANKQRYSLFRHSPSAVKNCTAFISIYGQTKIYFGKKAKEHPALMKPHASAGH